MTQKVLKVGSSAAVTIPKKSLEELGLKVGDRVAVEIDKKSKAVIIKPLVMGLIFFMLIHKNRIMHF